MGRPLWREDGSFRLQLLLALASTVILGFLSRWTHHILLSQIRDSPFRRLLRLAGLPPPHGICHVFICTAAYIHVVWRSLLVRWHTNLFLFYRVGLVMKMLQSSGHQELTTSISWSVDCSFVLKPTDDVCLQIISPWQHGCRAVSYKNLHVTIYFYIQSVRKFLMC
jgi:hypothetical protein